MNRSHYLSAFGLGIVAYLFVNQIIQLLGSLIFDFHFITDHFTRDLLRNYLPILIAIFILFKIAKSKSFSQGEYNFKTTFTQLVFLYIGSLSLNIMLPIVRELYQNDTYWDVLNDYARFIDENRNNKINKLLFTFLPNVILNLTVIVFTYLIIWKDPMIIKANPKKINDA